MVILEDQIYLYDISNMKLLYTIETSPNPNGIGLFTINLASAANESQLYAVFLRPQKAVI